MATTRPPSSENHFASPAGNDVGNCRSSVIILQPGPSRSSNRAVRSPIRTRPWTKSEPATGSPGETIPPLTPGRSGTDWLSPPATADPTAAPRPTETTGVGRAGSQICTAGDAADAAALLGSLRTLLDSGCEPTDRGRTR